MPRFAVTYDIPNRNVEELKAEVISPNTLQAVRDIKTTLGEVFNCPTYSIYIKTIHEIKE